MHSRVATPRPAPESRAAFATFRPVPTRWADNDAYGHVNNVAYYSYFDTAVNAFLIENGVLDLGASRTIGLVVETGCVFFESAKFPEPLEAALRVDHLGRSAVRYAIGIFRVGGERAIAQGHFVHVYVDRVTQRPVPIPAEVRAALAPLSPPLAPAEEGRGR